TDAHVRDRRIDGKAVTLEDDTAPLDRPQRANGRHAAHGTSAFVVELDVPVEVVAPRVGRVAEPNRDANGGRLVGTSRDANEMHAGLLWRAPALAAVAGD